MRFNVSPYLTCSFRLKTSHLVLASIVVLSLFAFGECGTCDLVTTESGTTCSNYKTACECSQNGCEFSTAKGICVSRTTCQKLFEKCPGSSFNTTCLRKGSYYVHGGVLCKNEEDVGICKILGTVRGVRSGLPSGSGFRDIRGVVYLHEPFEDPDKTLTTPPNDSLEKACPWSTWKGEPASNLGNYKWQVVGKNGGRNCLHYKLPVIMLDGTYEISIKMVENHWNDSRRAFWIRLGDTVLAQELDVFGHVGKCQPMEIIVPFQISGQGSTIQVQGFDPKPNDAKSAGWMSFCYGTCGGKDQSYIFSSFYIARTSCF